MNRFQQRAALVPRTITWLLVSPLIAVGAYWWLAYAGLYRLLAEWQLHSFHQYYPTYTGIITIILCLIPAIVAIQIIGAQREGERGPAEAAAQLAGYAERRARNSHWIQSRRRRLTGLVVTVMLAGAGVYFTGIGLLAGDQVSVDVGAIERGDQPGGRWAAVTGRLVANDAVSVAERRSSSAHVYVPLVSPEWRPGQPVRVYLKTYESWLDRYADDLASGLYDGMLAENDLPGVAITSLAEGGHPAPDRYWVLEYKATPKSKRNLGNAMFGGAGVAGLITALAWLIAGRRERAAARPSP
jgi:hypothetical protein